ncbi:MAG TPA: type IV secretion system protein [Vicinamibacterales bacterium]|nr:type IV secretion system protein [Vicinamibacterales bacterium]
MITRKKVGLLATCVLLFSGAPAVHAQWAVIDVGAIAQLIEQIATMYQQLETARSTLRQAEQQYRATTGGRGMERLLSGTDRNYLPTNWAQLEAAVQRADGTYRALGTRLQALLNDNALLSAERVAALSPIEREQLQAARRSAALFQATSRQALETTSGRFQALQQLVDAIPAAQDQKAILDLQARIAAEQAMLANEQTKLNVLHQVAQAEELARQQRVREQALADIGSLRRLPPMGL